MKIVVNNSYSIVYCEDLKLFRKLQKQFQVKYNNSFFMQQKINNFVGFYSFLDDKGNIPTGLVYDLIAYLETNKINYNLVNNLKMPVIDTFTNKIRILDKQTKKPIETTLFDHQIPVVKEILDKGRGVLDLATNAGKTEIMISVIKNLKQYNLNFLIILANIQLLEDTTKRLEIGLAESVNKYHATNKIMKKGVNTTIINTLYSVCINNNHIEKKLSPKKEDNEFWYFSTKTKSLKVIEVYLDDELIEVEHLSDTFLKRSDKAKYYTGNFRIKKDLYIKRKNKIIVKYKLVKKSKFIKYQNLDLLKDIDYIFIDELHAISSSDKWYKLLLKLTVNISCRIGLTGTSKVDNKLKETYFTALTGPALYKISNEDLINLGKSAVPTVHVINCPDTRFGKVPFPMEVKRAYNSRETFVVLNELTQDYGNLIMISTTEEGELLQQILTDSIFLQGKDKVKYRNQVLEDWGNKKYKTIIATKIFKFGLDTNNIRKLILLSIGANVSKVKQEIGRGLRLNETGKVDIYFFDYIQSRYLTEHTKKVKKICKNENFIVKTYKSIDEYNLVNNINK